MLTHDYIIIKLLIIKWTTTLYKEKRKRQRTGLIRLTRLIFTTCLPATSLNKRTLGWTEGSNSIEITGLATIQLFSRAALAAA